jgi:hypothetical protein
MHCAKIFSPHPKSEGTTSRVLPQAASKLSSTAIPSPPGRKLRLNRMKPAEDLTSMFHAGKHHSKSARLSLAGQHPNASRQGRLDERIVKKTDHAPVESNIIPQCNA